MAVGYIYDEKLDKFTGKERDAESGLDNFGKRYFGSSLGRFQTPDPAGIMRQKLVDPQQWNMYAYVRNNPLRFVDPTGAYLVNCNQGDKKCNKAADEFEKQRQKDLKSKDPKVPRRAGGPPFRISMFASSSKTQGAPSLRIFARAGTMLPKANVRLHSGPHPSLVFGDDES